VATVGDRSIPKNNFLVGVLKNFVSMKDISFETEVVITNEESTIGQIKDVLAFYTGKYITVFWPFMSITTHQANNNSRSFDRENITVYPMYNKFSYLYENTVIAAINNNKEKLIDIAVGRDITTKDTDIRRLYNHVVGSFTIKVEDIEPKINNGEISNDAELASFLYGTFKDSYEKILLADSVILY
jgi:hypothetical protein